VAHRGHGGDGDNRAKPKSISDKQVEREQSRDHSAADIDRDSIGQCLHDNACAGARGCDPPLIAIDWLVVSIRRWK
jgi:hypothetical protein